MKYISFILVLLLFISSLYSEDVDTTSSGLEDEFVMDGMVVTTTRSERPLSKSPASVSVISSEDIEKSPAKNVDDLLKSAMGVQMKRVTGFGEGIPSDIIIRGVPGALAASRTLILIDGVPTNAGGTPFFIINEVSLSAIERVEIVRGPYSSLYGSNAFGGVINIITKSGEGRPSLYSTFETTWPFSVAYKYINRIDGEIINDAVRDGSRDAYYGVNGTFDGSFKKLSYLIDGGYRTVGNYTMNDSAFEKGPNGIVRKRIDNNDYRDAKVFGKINVEFTDKISASLQARFFDSELGFAQTKGILPDSLDIIMAGQKIVVGPKVDWRINDAVDISFSGYFQRLIGEYWNEEPAEPVNLPSYWKSIADETQFNIINSVKLGELQTITSGFSFVYNKFSFGNKENYLTGEVLEGSKSVDQNANNVALYVQDEIKYKEELLVVPGVRLDYHSEFGLSLSPKLSALYAFNDLFRIRGSLGRAFRAPNIAEYAMPDLSIDPTYSLNSNPNLKPERIWAFDGAAVFTYKKWIELDVGGFYNSMSDLVGQGMVLPVDSSGKYDLNDLYLTHENIDKAWSRGVEITIKSKPFDWIEIKGDLVIQNSQNETLKELYLEHFEDKILAKTFDYSLDYIPHIKGGISSTFLKKFKKNNVSFNISWLGVGERVLRDLALVDPSNDIQPVLEDKLKFYILPVPIKLAPYYTTDLSVRVEFQERLDFSINFINIFDEKYEESSGTEGTGRFATIKIGFKL